MALDRKRLVWLGAFIVVGAIAYRIWPPASGVTAPASNNRTAGPRASKSATGPGAAAVAAPDVHLSALEGERPKPADTERDLFRFKPKPPPPAPKVTRPEEAPGPSGPPPAPALPPIALKFIGIVQQGTDSPRIAVLTDGRHVPFYGREGDIIEGRYKILRIGTESIEMAYLDGRGRQTIRLTGS